MKLERRPNRRLTGSAKLKSFLKLTLKEDGLCFRDWFYCQEILMGSSEYSPSKTSKNNFNQEKNVKIYFKKKNEVWDKWLRRRKFLYN